MAERPTRIQQEEQELFVRVVGSMRNDYRWFLSFFFALPPCICIVKLILILSYFGMHSVFLFQTLPPNHYPPPGFGIAPGEGLKGKGEKKTKKASSPLMCILCRMQIASFVPGVGFRMWNGVRLNAAHLYLEAGGGGD